MSNVQVDTFGWIDPYVEVSHGDLTQQTEIRKKEENPRWTQNFKVPVADTNENAAIEFRLYDWELTAKNRAIGSVKILLETIHKAGTIERAFPLQKEDGSSLLGRGNAQSTLRLKLTYEVGEDNPERAALNAAIEEAKQRIKEEQQRSNQAEAEAKALKDLRESSSVLQLPYRIRVTLKGASHLPKMDTLGSIDAYCVLTLGGQEFRSATCKNTYEPDWKEETFELSVSSRSQSLEIKVMDWDRGSKDELCGVIRIPVGRLKPGRLPADRNSYEPYSIFGADGRQVIGHDKKPAEVKLAIEAMDVQEGEDKLDASVNTASIKDFVPWKVEVVMENAKNLPKMDTFGKSISHFRYYGIYV